MSSLLEINQVKTMMQVCLIPNHAQSRKNTVFEKMRPLSGFVLKDILLDNSLWNLALAVADKNNNNLVRYRLR